MIYTPEQSAAILRAIEALELANNGWTYISAGLVQALTAAGYTVIRSTDPHGKPAYKAFTSRAQKALQTDGAPNYKAFSTPLDTPDLEPAILARQYIPE